jgi:hypothetical protein
MNTDLSSFAHLMDALCDRLGVPSANWLEGDEFEFTTEESVLVIRQHPEGDAVMVEVEILMIDEDADPKLNFERYRLLHQLNAYARLTHGVMAFVTDEPKLLISRTQATESLDANSLMEVFNGMLTLAESIRTAWFDMARLSEMVDAAADTSSLQHTWVRG